MQSSAIIGTLAQDTIPFLATWKRPDKRCLPGWDVFILKYDVEEPVATVLDGAAMKAYLRMFRLLWALKRAEHSLNDCWVDLNSVQRQLTAFPTYIKRSGANAYSAPLPPALSMQRSRLVLRSGIRFALGPYSWAALECAASAVFSMTC